MIQNVNVKTSKKDSIINKVIKKLICLRHITFLDYLLNSIQYD